MKGIWIGLPAAALAVLGLMFLVTAVQKGNESFALAALGTLVLAGWVLLAGWVWVVARKRRESF